MQYYISHHGIAGQKWGVRNADWYPIAAWEAHLKRTSNSPESLSSFMKKNIKYSEFSILKSADEVAKSKSGSCHDQVMYEVQQLRKMGKDPKCQFVIEYNPKTNRGGMTHSFVYFKDGKGIKYLENAWGGHEGIKSFRNVKEVQNYFRSEHKKENFGNSSKYGKLEFSEFDPDDHEPGETLQEFVDKCLKN